VLVVIMQASTWHGRVDDALSLRLTCGGDGGGGGGEGTAAAESQDGRAAPPDTSWALQGAEDAGDAAWTGAGHVCPHVTRYRHDASCFTAAPAGGAPLAGGRRHVTRQSRQSRQSRRASYASCYFVPTAAALLTGSSARLLVCVSACLPMLPPAARPPPSPPPWPAPRGARCTTRSTSCMPRPRAPAP
jgi:hypothetical protein